MTDLISRARDMLESINEPQIKSGGGLLHVTCDGRVIGYGAGGFKVVSHVERLLPTATDEQIREFLETELAIWEMQG